MQVNSSTQNPLIAGLTEVNQPRTTKTAGQIFPIAKDTVSISQEALALAELMKTDNLFASASDMEAKANSLEQASTTDESEASSDPETPTSQA